MKFSYFIFCSALCCGMLYTDKSIGMNNVSVENLVLSKAREFAESAREKPAASELMSFIKTNGIKLSILHDLQNQLDAIGYTVSETPTNTGYNYHIAFSPLRYHQHKNGGVVSPQTANPTSARNDRKKPATQASKLNTTNSNHQLNEIKTSIDGLSALIQELIQSVDELKNTINRDNVEDDENMDNYLENQED